MHLLDHQRNKVDWSIAPKGAAIQWTDNLAKPTTTSMNNEKNKHAPVIQTIMKQIAQMHSSESEQHNNFVMRRKKCEQNGFHNEKELMRDSLELLRYRKRFICRIYANKFALFQLHGLSIFWSLFLLQAIWHRYFEWFASHDVI